MSVKWKLNNIYFSINPDSVCIDRNKNIHIIDIIDGTSVLQEGRDAPPTISASGWVLSETAYAGLNTWYETGGVLTLIDDHADSFNVIISSLKLDRRRYASNQWVYYFTINFYVISGL